jgi:hypothetical protein
VRPAAVEDGHYLARSGGGMCEEEDQQLLTGPQGVKTFQQLFTGPQGVKTLPQFFIGHQGVKKYRFNKKIKLINW